MKCNGVEPFYHHHSHHPHNFHYYHHYIFIKVTHHQTAQANDARHEECNKKGQNLFEGETVEIFKRSFSVVDDVAAVRAKMFSHCGTSDPQNRVQQFVPNYEPVVTKMRIGLRKSGYLSEPLKVYPFVSMAGKPLNSALKKLFSNAVAARESDIRQVICHNDFRKGYDPKNKIDVLEEDAKKPKNTFQQIQEVKDGIKIMIETLADS